MEWIKCSDRLPESIKVHADEVDLVIVTNGEWVHFGEYENGSWYDENGDEFDDDGIIITHWMPLPNPPKE